MHAHKHGLQGNIVRKDRHTINCSEYLRINIMVQKDYESWYNSAIPRTWYSRESSWDIRLNNHCMYPCCFSMPSTPVTRKRAPKKCRICPGAPLKTDCEHGGKKNKPSGKQQVCVTFMQSWAWVDTIYWTFKKIQARSVTSPKSNKVWGW